MLRLKREAGGEVNIKSLIARKTMGKKEALKFGTHGKQIRCSRVIKKQQKEDSEEKEEKKQDLTFKEEGALL